MKRRSFLIAGSAGAVLAPHFVRAQGSRQPFKFNLAWKIEASGAGYILAAQRGYYRDAGLDVVIDTGNGSGSAVSLVAGGAYDCATADLATMIEFNLANPGVGMRAVAIQFAGNPNSVMVRADGPIKRPADFAGKTLLGQPFNSSRKLFPVFAKAQGFDPSTVKWESVDPNIGDTRFVKGDFDGVAYHIYTGLLNLKARGMTSEQLRIFKYSDFGVNSYGNGLVSNGKVIAERPDALKAFVAATAQGWLDAVQDPNAAVASLKARDGLINEALERERLQLLIDAVIKVPDASSSGWGQAKPARLQATLDETVAAAGLKRTPAIDELWTDRFLPPANLRAAKA